MISQEPKVAQNIFCYQRKEGTDFVAKTSFFCSLVNQQKKQNQDKVSIFWGVLRWL